MFITFEMGGERYMYNINHIVSLKQKHEVISIRTINVQDNFTYDGIEGARKNFLLLQDLIDKAKGK